MAEKQKSTRHPVYVKLTKIGLILIGLFLLYIIAGFWIVPPIIKPRIEKILSDQLGRKATIEEIKLNPLVLSATTNKLTIYETDGEPFAGFETLYANAQVSSIFRWAITVKEVRIEGPFGVLKMLPKGKLNIDDIVARLSQPKPEAEPDAGLPRAIIYKFQVIDGKAVFSDLIGSEPIDETFAPISFTLNNLSTLKEREGEYSFDGQGTDGGKYHLDGRVTVNPVRVQGSFSSTGTNLDILWSHVKSYLSFQLAKATASSYGEYEIAVVDGKLEVRLSNGRFELKDFQLVEKGQDAVLISVPSLKVQGAGADLRARQITVDKVNIDSAGIFSWLSPDGTLKLQSLLLADLKAIQEMKPVGAGEPEAAAGSPWQVDVNEITLAGCGATVEDRTLPKPATLTLDDIAVSVKKLSTKKEAKADVQVKLQVNRSGSVAVTGAAGIDPLMADLKVAADKIALKPFQPYVDAAVNARIQAGTTSAAGRILYKGKSAEPQINFQGQMRVDGVEVDDLTPNQDFIELHQLKTDGIDLELLPNKLHVEKVLITEPKAHVTIDQAGIINVVQAFTPNETEKDKEEKDLLQRLVGFLITQFKGPMPMDVKLVELDRFSGDFFDSSVSPPYKTHLEITRATVNGLSSAPSAKAAFKMEGSIDKTASIEGSGRINPMNAMQYARMDFTLKDFTLNPVSPYSGKFIGYKIANGTLKTVLKYEVDGGRVDGDNQIFIDDLTLGEKVDSPDALKLPIALGVALLKDDEGRIALQAPVQGSVKDPKFNWGQVIKSALTGTIKDVGKSPFGAIAQIDGFKGEELRFVVFEAGRHDLNEREIQKLDALAKFLGQRKTLELAIQATADREADWAALTGRPVEKKSSEEGSVEGKKDAKGANSDQAVDETKLKELAQKRAEQVKLHLIETGGLAVDRIKVEPEQIKQTAQSSEGQVEFFLSAQ